jgi:type I restriction enzyme, R subunit
MTIHRQLQAMPPLLTERLRECQIDAVTKLEASLAADRPRALIQMATGAGKTYTACVFSHRLLEHAKFRRVLFLADRANLVRQTRHEFEDFRPAGTGRSFTELYNVQRLGSAGLDKDASVVIATIQRVYSLLTGRELSEEDEEKSGFETGASEPQRLVRYNPAIPIESFELIITDECHRSIYGTWRQVLEFRRIPYISPRSSRPDQPQCTTMRNWPRTCCHPTSGDHIVNLAAALPPIC